MEEEKDVGFCGCFNLFNRFKSTLCCQHNLKKTVDEDELLINPFEIDRIAEIILKNMKKVDDLKNARLVSNTWNRNAAKVLSTRSIQGKIKPFLSSNIGHPLYTLTNGIELLKNSENRKIFQNIEFGSDICFLLSVCLFAEQTYLEIFKIVEMAHPTHVTFMIEFSKNLDVTLFTKFLLEISQNIVQLKLEIVSKEAFLVEEESLQLEFPKLKTLEIRGISQHTISFMRVLLRNCHFLDDLKVDVKVGGIDSDKFLPALLTPEIAQNLQKLHLAKTRFEFKNLKPLVLSVLNLKSLKVDTTELDPVFRESYFILLVFPQFKSFLISQSKSLEKFTLNFNFVTCKNLDFFLTSNHILRYPLSEAYRILNGTPDGRALDIPRLEHLKIFKLKYGGQFALDEHTNWPVLPINLPVILPNLKKIVISFNQRWRMSFVADEPCESVEELVLEDWSKENMYMADLVSLFPNVKYLKMKFSDYPGEEEMEANLNSIEGWSSTLKKIDVQFQDNFPQNFNFQGLSSLSNLEHLYLHQKTRSQDQNAIQPDFTPLFNMKKLSNLVIERISRFQRRSSRSSSRNSPTWIIHSK